MSKQLQLWRSMFGRDYTDRNDVEKPERVETWRKLLDGISVERALEVGCNAGWNLEYLTRLGVPAIVGVEPGVYAAAKARSRNFNVLDGTAFELPFRDGWFDLAFTSGVLIHIAPDDVGKAMAEIYRCSRRYIVAIEYDAPEEKEVSYRGHDGALWKRDHGALWQARYPELKLVKRMFLDAAQGYDDCTAHLFEKS